MPENPEISILTMMELSNAESTLLKWALIIIVLLIIFFIFNSTRAFSKGTPGKKLSFRKRSKTTDVDIILIKSRRFNPSNIGMMVTNNGTKEIDLYAPVIIFRRWFTKRKFRILRVEHSEIYPILLEPGKTSAIDILLDQFYDKVPELQLACRMNVEMKDRNGKRFKSRTIRLKWF